MKRSIFAAALTVTGLLASTGYACNGGGGGGSGATSTGSTGTGALGSALRTGLSMNSSPFVQQSALQQLVAQRMLQQRYQQALAAQQQLLNDQSNQVVTTRAEWIKQTREEKIAKRNAREAEQLAKRE